MYSRCRGRGRDQGCEGHPAPVPVPGQGPAPYVVSMETVGGCQESGGTAAMLRRDRWRKDPAPPRFRATPLARRAPMEGGARERERANQRGGRRGDRPIRVEV